jgi:hypothetical protein
MELRPFISQTLIDIIGGVKDAQEKTDPGTIVPSVASSYKSIETGISEIGSIEFEVSVNADEHSRSGTKISVVAAVIGGTTHAGSGKSGGHAATLKFRIPVKLPVSKT